MLNPKGGERAGVGHYTTALVTALLQRYSKEEFVLFFDHHMDKSVVDGFAKRTNVQTVLFPLSAYKRYLPFGYSHVVTAHALRAQQLDVFHSPAYVLPLSYTRPSVVTIHDLAIYKHPSWFPPRQFFSRSVVVPRSVKRASAVIAVSQATAQAVRSEFAVPSEKVHVVYEGCTRGPRTSNALQQAVRDRYKIGDQFLLFVGTVEPRKNLVNLVKAFDQYKDAQYPRSAHVQLVIAGAKGWRHEPIFRAIARAKWSSHIRVIGYVTAEEKMALLDSCLFFVFPSLWEGFGLPVLEAASRGVPVLTSSVSSLPEVGGAGALYVQPDRIRSIQEGIQTLMRSASKRESLGRKGKEHATTFTWARAAQQTMEVYRSVAEIHKK